MMEDSGSRVGASGYGWTVTGNESVRFGFSPDPSAPGEARRAVSSALEEWDLARLAPMVELLVSEVVTNAVQHAASPGELEVRYDGDILRVSVSDLAGGEPGPRRPGPDEPSGRGLAIVETVAARWGVGHEDVGKTVWFELDVDDAALEV